MKKIRRISALILTAAMFLGLSGCSLFDSRLIKAVRAMGELESFHGDISADFSGIVSVLDSSHELELQAKAETDMILSPLSFKLEGEVLNQQLFSPVVVYGKSDASSIVVAVGAADSQTLSQYALNLSGEARSIEPGDIIKLITSGALLFEEKGSEDIGGSPATRYDGVINEQVLKTLLAIYGSNLSISGDIPMSIWVDNESSMIVRLDADLSGIAGAFGEYLAGLVKLSIAGNDISVNVKAEKLALSILFSQFNAIEEVKLPEGM